MFEDANALGEVRVILPLYLPSGSVVGATAICRFAGVVLLVGVTTSHAAGPENCTCTVNGVPAPVELTARNCGAGIACPVVYANVKEPGVAESPTGATTVSVTGTAI